MAAGDVEQSGAAEVLANLFEQPIAIVFFDSAVVRGFR
jgi:hypothetical protein